MNDRGVCRTAPATPSMLKTMVLSLANKYLQLGDILSLGEPLSHWVTDSDSSNNNSVFRAAHGFAGHRCLTGISTHVGMFQKCLFIIISNDTKPISNK